MSQREQGMTKGLPINPSIVSRLLAVALPAFATIALAQFTTPHLTSTAGSVTNILGPTKFINQGLIAVGHISASALDTFGESLGSCSGMQITGWTNNGNGSYSGTLNILPDRGYNSGGFWSDFATRINRISFKLTPYYGATNIGGADDLARLNAQTNHLAFGAISGVKFTYDDPLTGMNSFTTGLNPGTNVATLFGQTMPYVTTFVGTPSPSTTNNVIYKSTTNCRSLRRRLASKPTVRATSAMSTARMFIISTRRKRLWARLLRRPLCSRIRPRMF